MRGPRSLRFVVQCPRWYEGPLDPAQLRLSCRTVKVSRFGRPLISSSLLYQQWSVDRPDRIGLLIAWIAAGGLAEALTKVAHTEV